MILVVSRTFTLLKPRRTLTVSGRRVLLRTAATTAARRGRSCSSPEPAPERTTLGTGQPMFRSMPAKAVSAETMAAASARASGLAPKSWMNCGVRVLEAGDHLQGAAVPAAQPLGGDHLRDQQAAAADLVHELAQDPVGQPGHGGQDRGQFQGKFADLQHKSIIPRLLGQLVRWQAYAPFPRERTRPTGKRCSRSSDAHKPFQRNRCACQRAKLP